MFQESREEVGIKFSQSISESVHLYVQNQLLAKKAVIYLTERVCHRQHNNHHRNALADNDDGIALVGKTSLILHQDDCTIDVSAAIRTKKQPACH